MTKHAVTTDATGSAGGAGGAKMTAESNGDPECLAHARELFAQLSDVRSLRGIA